MSKTILFNPYTGKPRHPSDIASDPAGILIVEPGAPLYASQPKPAPVLLTEDELIDIIDSSPTGWRERFRAIESAVLRKNGWGV